MADRVKKRTIRKKKTGFKGRPKWSKIEEENSTREQHGVDVNISCNNISPAQEDIVKCSHNFCEYESEFPSSKSPSKGFDKESCVCNRSLGHGHSGLEKFTTLMDMSKPMTRKNYEKTVDIVSTVAKCCRRNNE